MAFLDGYPLREKKEIYQSGLVLTLLDAYQMGEKFSKPFIKTAFSCSTTWGRKLLTAKARFLVILVAYLFREENIFSKGLIFGFSRDLPLEEENFEAGTTFDLSKWEQVKEYSKQGWKNWLLAAYSLREENFLRMTPQTASLSGNKWRENNSLEPAHFELSRWLLFGGTKLFWKHLLKRPLPVGISREKKFSTGP